MTIYSDQSKMPFGVHEGKALANVPASYLLWLADQKGFDKKTPLGVYIENNRAALIQKMRKDKNLRRYRAALIQKMRKDKNLRR